jgi:hypothetical protein
LKLQKQVEFTTEEIKKGRKRYYKDALQPFRHGELSKEYLQTYGTNRLQVSEEETKGAKNVWGDLNYYQDP